MSQCGAVCCSDASASPAKMDCAAVYLVVCCSVLQCVAVCCSVLQCVAVMSLQVLPAWTAVDRCSAWYCLAVRCSVLQCVVLSCSALQCVAVLSLRVPLI